MRGHCGVPCDSACGRTAADATLPAADASTTPTTPGRNAWARAPMNIQPRTARENRTAAGVMSPEVANVDRVQCNLADRLRSTRATFGAQLRLRRDGTNAREKQSSPNKKTALHMIEISPET